MLSHFFGRLGCLFYGCCYGRESHSEICISYFHPALKAVRERRLDTRSLYPTQIYSAFYGLAIFLIVFISWYYGDMPIGLPTALICILYGLFRFVEERYRAQKTMIFGQFSPSQLVCICVVVAGIVQTADLLLKDYIPAYTSLRNAGILPFRNNTILIIGMGLLSILIFSYHRYEIGKWGERRNAK